MYTKKPFLVAIDFFEDESGLLSLIIERNGGRDTLTWREFLNDKSSIDLLNRYAFAVRARYPHLMEKETASVNEGYQARMLRLRRFISRWQAIRKAQDEPWDFIFYANGEMEINIDELTCVEGCPVLAAIKQTIANGWQMIGDHATKSVIKQTERAMPELPTIAEFD